MDRRKFMLTATSAAAAGCALPSGIVPRASAAVSQHDLEKDPLRPQFHLLAPANWMNDPDAPIYWKNNYHMFYQYNPNGAYWGDMHWGHAVSKDMVHWKHLPMAFIPTPGGPDTDGCFTGTSVVQDGKVVVLYTGVRLVPEAQATIKGGAQSFLETQCVATSTDPDLKAWTKVAEPIIEAPPPGLQVNGFRDPSPWRQGDWWYMVLGSGIANQGGNVLLYKSKDLLRWEYVHVLAGRNQSGEHRFDPYNPWECWECPEFFPLGAKHVLIYSTGGKAFWQSGEFNLETLRFHPEQAGILDYGSYYAPKTQLDKSGNRILWGWIQESRALEQYKAAGWAGLMSLPRVLSLDSHGRLQSSVATEVNTLRGAERVLNRNVDEEDNQRQIKALRIEGCCGEILCTVQRTAEPFELILSASAASSTPWLTLKYEPQHPGQVAIDAHPIPIALPEHENLEFHFYIDGSVIELFVNNQVACSRRFYYPGRNAQDLGLNWTGKTAHIVSLSAWQLSPISSNRLTT